MNTPGGEQEWAQARLVIPNTGGHGTARLDAVTALAHALGCQSRSREPLTGYFDRSLHGDYYLTVWGPVHVVTWLSHSLPSITAGI